MIEPLALKYKLNNQIEGVLVVQPGKENPPMYDGADKLLFIVSNGNLRNCKSIIHYIKDGKRIQERWINIEEMKVFLFTNSYIEIRNSLLKGEIILDRYGNLGGLRQTLLDLPEQIREWQLFVEFAQFLNEYVQGKRYSLQGQQMDSYQHILEALRHWAQIVLIEEGEHPDLGIWGRIKQVNPGVYKLYEELTMSKETIKQRVELVLLACEFSVMSKMEKCCKPLLALMEERQEAWSMTELQQLTDLQEVRNLIPIVVHKLVKRGLIEEVFVPRDEDLTELLIRYVRTADLDDSAKGKRI
ncbi:hypothetical protein ERICIV_03692 [Paenibacillus larvae subsp. larvae]|uniref:Uncharacterized protein n=3 Tax=Paenibacillus larvae TaxID=1464 RepID=A0A1U9YLN6_9BACL|nr:nucleotidyltransferase-like protein [Paenibacillus larvae]AQZ46348.1 hypothetical protein B5S25_06690 [Paenibacillus larvae subsp. pulvifaciens]ARF67677.1 hypothetical protein B7C51_07355 [Paenibacillus larvae subsp. pulvifaciens]AVF28034.1 hypothetical protein ERICIII_03949 [Paenibacillus larvae subsp. larvae]AVF32537.1 hypothetical protein ERICIV_03692 [Paenibacillus larvae subsp. larvae]MCY7519758.1 nucleotidyltransferase-like protein [Paenibacillus larvae]